jgi:hypothetical protein
VRGQPGAPVVGFSLTDVELQGWGEYKPDARVGADPSTFAAIMVDGAVNVTVARVELHAGASTGVAWGGDVSGLLLDRITVSDAGGGGIGALYSNNENATGVVISNCTVHDVGDVYVVQPAGIAAGGRDVAVLHNEVYSVAYSGIIGVQPGGPPPPAGAAADPAPAPVFTIAFNNVTDFGLGVLNDFGGIYIAVYGECWLSQSCWLPADVHHNLVVRGAAYNYGANENVFFGAQPGAPMPLHYPNGTLGLAAWRAAWGCDVDSVEADPMLAYPAAGDFSVLPSSPAWALGWQAIDLSAVGPLSG